MKKLYLLAAALWVLGMAGCNTMAGLGQDTKAAGQAIEDKAKK